MNLLLGVISEVLNALADTYRKLAIDNSRLPKAIFAIFASFLGLIIVFPFIFAVGEKLSIFTNVLIIFVVFVISIIQLITNFTYINVYKNIKISQLLPYGNIGSLFTVIVSFFLFYGTENQTSLESFLITLFTVFVIIASNINLKKFYFSKYILFYIGALVLDSIAIMAVGYLLLNYSSLNYMSLTIVADFILYLGIIVLYKQSFKLLLKQNKVFYKSRLLSTILGRIGFLIGLYIMETSGVLIATLISFFGLVFSVFSMKYILHDTPSKKDVIIAFIVMILISCGYYFA